MPEQPPESALEELRAQVAGLRSANARLREVIEAKDAQLAAAGAALEAAEARFAALSDRVTELERRLGKDSSTSSRPPWSDSPYKKPKDRSLRRRTGRRPGKQPGAESATLRQVADPAETVVCAQPPAGVTGRAQYGPEVHAQAANPASAHYLPVARAAELMGAMTGVNVSSGFMAGVRGKAAAKLEPFMAHMRDLLHQAGVVYADETPARAAGGLKYVHVACTQYLTRMHTGGRSAADIDAGACSPAMPAPSCATATPAMTT